MRIISKKALRDFWQRDTAAETPLRYWYSITEKADWADFPGVRNTFRAADRMCDCVVFDVGGNKYRIIAKIDYKYKIVFIRFVLTHREYDENKWKDDCNCKKGKRGKVR